MNVVIRLVFCAALFVFPFSVAVTNTLLGVGLALGVLSGCWLKGAMLCWLNYRRLTIVFGFYMLMLVFGLLWSLDVKWGLHVLGRHWFWLLVPVVVALFVEFRWRKYFLISLSSGLALNLVYCVLQMYGFVEVTTDGSSAEDATGHIGHIGFGFVYGVWAAWLLHLGLIWKGWSRYLAWFMAAWSYVMIFSAQGRSGYLIAIVLIGCLCVKWVFDSQSWRVVLPIMVCLFLIVTVVGFGPGQERLQGTWAALKQMNQENILDQGDSADNATLATRERLVMWKASLDIWSLYPILGVGTGGLPQAVVLLKKDGLSSFSHPHNQYLLALVRWGPLGVLFFLMLLVVWAREGLMVDWQNSVTAPLFSLSAIALALHGLSSASMEEHFSAILAVLLLAVAIANDEDKRHM